jgi:superfamily II DNA/RNA helicase
MNEKNQSPEKKKKRRITLLYILSGGILSEAFVIRHTRMILLVVLLVLIDMGNRSGFLQKLREIDRLQRELKEVKYESVALSGQLTDSNRQSQIEDLVKAQGLELERAKTPPYLLYK